ncbi:MAG: hypothetical protein QOG42_352 [Solirubrobacteraceae bacterium]|jgi:hypothetical protein|nr:hypothetical protein [Solirubrobacteraceae bacterium]
MRRLLPLTILLALVLAAPAAASRTQSLTFEAPRDLMNPDLRDGALDEIGSFGVRSLRVILTWKSVAPAANEAQRPNFEPTDPGAYDWSEYEPLMAAIKARGWSVLMTISGPVPVWATQDKRDDKTRPSPSAFAAFVTAVGRKFGDQVDTWAIWNEPNQPQFLRPQYADGGHAASPGIYRNLYLAGVRGLRKSGQGDDKILIAETSPRGNSNVVAPLRFLRGMLCLDSRYKKRPKCSALPADGYAHHAYTTRQGPFFKPPQKDDVTIGVLSRLTTALDRARSAGALTKRLPIYLTEFGIQSTPDTQQGVSLTQQVQYRAISERTAWNNPRVVAFSQYLLTDSEPTGPKQYGGFESGLRFADGRPKPSLAGFRLPLAVKRTGSRVSIWGLVRPATGATSATVTYADGGGSFKRLRTVTTDARGYFTLSSTWHQGRRWNLTWEGQSGSPVAAYQAP